MTVRIARWSAKHPWVAIGSWLALVVVAVALGSIVNRVSATDAQLEVGESATAVGWEKAAGLDDPVVEKVLISPANPAAGAELTAAMRALPEVAKVGEPQRSADGREMLVPVTMAGDADTAADRVNALLDVTSAVQRNHPGTSVEQSGPASQSNGIDEHLGAEMGRAELISLPVNLIILVVAFGALVAAGVPVLLGLSAVGTATGLSTLVSHIFPYANSTNTVILAIGMAVGVDYSLFYLQRAREEREKHGAGKMAAIEVAAATSGHSVVVSGIAVIVSMAGLYLVGDTLFTSMASGSIIVILVAVVGSLTVLPALLAVLGPRIDKPRIALWKRRPGGGRVWPVLLRPALRRPLATLLLSGVAMTALAVPALSIKLRNTGPDDLPHDIPAVQVYQRIAADFPDGTSVHRVVARSAGQELDEVAKRAAANPLFTAGAPDVRTSADGTVSVLRLRTPYSANSPQAEESLRVLREQILPATLGQVPGATWAVTGNVASGVDYTTHQGEKLPWVVGFVLMLTFVMMTVMFRSVAVALTTLLLNGLSAGAAFGVLVLVFQGKWAEGLLNFTSTGAIAAWVPLFMFVVLSGLSMDYHVFVVSRIREAAGAGLSTKEAIRQGISQSAGVVSSAAIVMMSVFAIFATLSFIEMKQLGLGLAVAVLLDAVVVRVLILPSLMALLGRFNWWPGKLPVAGTPQVSPAVEVSHR